MAFDRGAISRADPASVGEQQVAARIWYGIKGAATPKKRGCPMCSDSLSAELLMI